MKSIFTIASITRQELHPLIRKIFSSDWGGSCAICSWQLNKVFKHCGYKSEFVVGFFKPDNSNYPLDHAFVICDSKIVDITATQFNLDEIIIRKVNDKNYSIYKQNRMAVQDLKEWPDYQQPATHRHFLNKAFNKTINRLQYHLKGV